MAGITNYAGGLRRIQFNTEPNGKVKCIRLGRVSMKVAEFMRAKIDAIIADKLAGRPHDAEVSRWLGGLDESMLAKLRAVGLADGVGMATETIGGLLDRHLANQTGKKSTRIFCQQVARNLRDFYGPARLVRNISAADADAWRAWLVTDQQLAPGTISRRVKGARTVWRLAIRWKMASENPFDGIKAGPQSNETRKRFIDHETINRVIDEAPDAKWRLIIALARYAGLRIPSELADFRWRDVNWAEGFMMITSPKTAHHEGKAVRTVPIFKELRPHLMAAFDAAPPGAEYVIADRGTSNINLRTQLHRIIRRAGIAPWPKTFQNLRASRETELLRDFDLATVCRWIGNTPAVAAQHYAMSRDLSGDIRRAAGMAHLETHLSSAAIDDRGFSTVTENPENPREIAISGNSWESAETAENAENKARYARQDSNLQPPGSKPGTLSN